jgi:hypothetical protein
MSAIRPRHPLAYVAVNKPAHEGRSAANRVPPALGKAEEERKIVSDITQKEVA